MIMSIMRGTLVVFFIVFTVVFIYFQDNLLSVENISAYFDNLPRGFEGYKVVHLSDLQGKVFFKNNAPLISRIKKVQPDLIVITGDLIDSGSCNGKPVLDLMDKIRRIAPVYYITGNHEMSARWFYNLEKKLKGLGINLLRNSVDKVRRNGDTILLAGIDDPIVTSRSDNYYSEETLRQELKDTLPAGYRANFTLLLSHRPEQFPLYAKYKIDLTFSGHAHGGQIRLPFIGGLVAPNQGFFPKYTSGKYTIGGSTMIVSRGLGNGTIPVRLFNRPEIIVTTLHKR